ncbi:aminotransferase DegT [Candidatus Poribacteria bacterium]|nr:aminotransferase DegT [Candidatus Poribacteria bacterium]
MENRLTLFIRSLFGTNDIIPLHQPYFDEQEKQYLSQTIDSTYVSSIGKFVEQLEENIAKYMEIEHAIATVNGTSALHMALFLTGVEKNTEVLTQSLTFVATCNAISYCSAIPVFIDVDIETLSLCPRNLLSFLEEFGEIREDGYCWNRTTGNRISACLPMHTFGFPAKIQEIIKVCSEYNIPVVEDSAESLGTSRQNQYTGTFGNFGILSFNGNKIITTGGGGMILTNDSKFAIKAKHLTTTAKEKSPWHFFHNEIGFNYRMPNLNAALGLAQLAKLPEILEKKRNLASEYHNWGERYGVRFVVETKDSCANYWLNVLIADDHIQRDRILKKTNENNIMTRPAWVPMHLLPIYQHSFKQNLRNTEWLFNRLVSVPSSPVSV